MGLVSRSCVSLSSCQTVVAVLLLVGATASHCPKDSHGLATLKGHICPSGQAIPSVSMCVWPPARDQFISGGIVTKGTWLTHNDEFIRRWMVCALVNTTIPGRAWIMDVGTNIGTVSLPLLAAGHNVLSFEAFGPNAAIFRASVAGLVHAQNGSSSMTAIGRSILVRKAVTAPGGPKQLCMANNEKNSGAASVSNGEGVGCADVVKTTTIDAELASLAVDAPVIIAGAKMDIEGHEHLALQGAEQLFAAAPPPIFFVEAIRNRPQITAFLRNYSITCKKMHAIQHDIMCRPPAQPHMRRR